MSQEPQEIPDPSVVPDDGAGSIEPPPAGEGKTGGLPPAVIEELQTLRARDRQRDEEMHQLRMGILQQANATPQQDPVEVAYRNLEAAADPDAWKYIGPVAKPLLAELAAARAAVMQMGSQLEFLSRRDREREAYVRLSQLIPDLDTLGPRLLDMVKDLDPETQRFYAANPQLLVPLAKVLREGKPAAARGAAVAAARAATTMDVGGAADTTIPLTADAIAKLAPGSKEFAAVQRSFWGR